MRQTWRMAGHDVMVPDAGWFDTNTLHLQAYTILLQARPLMPRARLPMTCDLSRKPKRGSPGSARNDSGNAGQAYLGWE